MKKTNTKKSSTSGTTKASAVKTAPKKKIVPAVPAVSKAAPAKKMPAKVVKKTATKQVTPKDMPKIDAPKATPKEGVKMLGILHLAGNLLSGGTLGIVLVLIYLLVRKNELSQLERETCYEIINFNLSFIIYAFVSSLLIMVLIGLLMLPVVLIAWFVLMIVGFLRHLEGQNYKYPFIIRFLA